MKRKRKFKKGLFIIWILLIGLYIQSYFKIGTPWLPAHISLKIFLRSVIIVLTWYFLVGPLTRQLLHWWLRKKQTRSQAEIKQVLELLPATRLLIAESWRQSVGKRKWKRISTFMKTLLVKTLSSLPSPPAPLHPSFVGTERGVGIFILTAPIQSGKTTSLINWSENRTDIYGILTPIINGKRVFMNAHTCEQWPMEEGREWKTHESDSLRVGRYNFSKTGFEKAIQVIRETMNKPGWLVIDEIGPLELRGEGFCEVLKEVLESRNDYSILVIREKDEMVEKIVNNFGITNFQIIYNISELKETPARRPG